MLNVLNPGLPDERKMIIVETSVILNGNIYEMTGVKLYL